MATTDKVSIALVHGAWADGSNWDDLVPRLIDAGFDVIAVQNPLTSLADDVAAANRAIDRLPGKVLLVGHSWGGAVITEAGRHEKVAGLVYVTGFAPDENESLTNILAGGGDTPPPEAFAGIDVDTHGFLWLTPEKLSNDFAQDLPKAKLRTMIAGQGPIAMRCFTDKLGAPAWKTRPSWYVLSDLDRMIPPPVALSMAQRAGARITHVSASHVSMISHPAEVAEVILAAARSLNQ